MEDNNIESKFKCLGDCCKLTREWKKDPKSMWYDTHIWLDEEAKKKGFGSHGEYVYNKAIKAGCKSIEEYHKQNAAKAASMPQFKPSFMPMNSYGLTVTQTHHFYVETPDSEDGLKVTWCNPIDDMLKKALEEGIDLKDDPDYDENDPFYQPDPQPGIKGQPMNKLKEMRAEYQAKVDGGCDIYKCLVEWVDGEIAERRRKNENLVDEVD